MSRSWRRLGLCLGSALLAATLATLVACGKDDAGAATVTASAAPLHGESCAACGMVMDEQPAPRGQVVYSDGHHAHACSIADLLLVAQTPSPHGKVVATFVEVQDAAADPVPSDAAVQPQERGEALHFVRGVARRGVMGAPVMAFRDAARAQAAAASHRGEVVDWAKLRAEGPGEVAPR
jgi:nitrous oxide reductase accessory protein NosL